MVKQKRKLNAAQPSNGNDSDGSDYEVDWQLTPTAAKQSREEQFPLPTDVAKNLNKRAGHKEGSSSDESDDEDVDGLPTLTTEQISAILRTVKNNQRFVLMVNNVSFTTAKEEVEHHFSQAGPVKGVRIPKRRSSGFVFVEMADPVGFQKAFLLDGSYMDGRKIRVNLSESGSKKSDSRIQLLMKKNLEIRKIRKKNKNDDNATAVSLVPEVNTTKAPPPLDKFLDKPKSKIPTKKESKQARKKMSLKAKLKHMAKLGIKV